MNTWLQDLRVAGRALLITLALGIGANMAIYTLLDQAPLRNLPIKGPSRSVLLRWVGGDTGSSYTRSDTQIYFSYPMYRDLHDQNSVFSCWPLLQTTSLRRSPSRFFSNLIAVAPVTSRCGGRPRSIW